MKSKIQFLHADTRKPSEAADTVTILTSSDLLGWEGIYVEHGYTHLFLADNVTIPQHYFAMPTSQAFTWEVKDSKGFKKCTTHPGQVCIYPANTPISHRVNSYNEFFLLTIEPAKVLDSLHDVKLKTRDQFIVRHNADDPQLSTLIHILINEANAGGPNGKIFLESITTALSIHFVTHYSVENERIPEYRSGLSRQQLHRALEYIEAHVTEDISLDAIAKEVGMSKYYFCRLFKQSTNLTAYQYVIQRRTARAKALLEKGEFTLAEIAERLGFSNQGHFTRAFKKYYNITPAVFQRTLS